MGTMQRRRRCMKEAYGYAPRSAVLDQFNKRMAIYGGWYRFVGKATELACRIGRHVSAIKNPTCHTAEPVETPRAPISPESIAEMKRIINQDAADRGYKLEWSE